MLIKFLMEKPIIIVPAIGNSYIIIMYTHAQCCIVSLIPEMIVSNCTSTCIRSNSVYALAAIRTNFIE